MDWTKLTDDPNDKRAHAQVLEELLRKRRVFTDRNPMRLVLDRIKGKRVLDIGICSHAEHYMTKGNWRHDHVRKAAGYCLGIDILTELIDQLKNDGYNVAVADATSDEDLGERFDIVFIGDTVEHVDNPVRLLQFARRHLVPDGSILVTTPNPFSRKFIRRFQREGTSVVNLDHVAWITPSMAMEIGRRAGLELQSYSFAKKMTGNPAGQWIKKLARRLQPVEYPFPDYLYEYVLTK